MGRSRRPRRSKWAARGGQRHRRLHLNVSSKFWFRILSALFSAADEAHPKLHRCEQLERLSSTFVV